MSVSAAELASHELIEAARLAAEHSFSETYAYVPAEERLEEVRRAWVAGPVIINCHGGLSCIMHEAQGLGKVWEQRFAVGALPIICSVWRPGVKLASDALELAPCPATLRLRPPCTTHLQDDVSQMRRKLEAIGRELSSVTEAEYRSLSPRMPSSPRHQKQQIGSAASVTITLPGSAAPTPPPTPTPVAPPAGEVMQNIVPLTPRLQPVETAREAERSSSGGSKVDDGKPKPEGNGHEILLQVRPAPACCTCSALLYLCWELLLKEYLGGCVEEQKHGCVWLAAVCVWGVGRGLAAEVSCRVKSMLLFVCLEWAPFSLCFVHCDAELACPDVCPVQGFNWESWKHNWFENMTHKAQEIADLGFTAVWLPPFTGEPETGKKQQQQHRLVC